MKTGLDKRGFKVVSPKSPKWWFQTISFAHTYTDTHPHPHYIYMYMSANPSCLSCLVFLRFKYRIQMITERS